MNSNFVPVKKVMNIINSCESTSQLQSCLTMIDNYTELLKKQGVVNSELVKKRLIQEYKQKKFQINMIRHFVEMQRKVFYRKLESIESV